MFKLEHVELDVRLEGHRVDVKRVTVRSGVNQILAATITLPSTKWGQQVMPGTRVHIYIKKGSSPWYSYFEGSVTNRPQINAGSNAKDINILAMADMDVLMNARMQFVDTLNTRGNPANYMNRLFLRADGGAVRIPVNAGLPIMTPFAALSKTDVSIAARIYGALQTILFLHPHLYNIMRRTNLFDKIMIDADNNAQLIDKADFNNNLAAQVNRLIGKESTAFQLLAMILNSIHYDFTSVAPMMKVDTKLPLRDSQLYLPKGYDIMKTGMPSEIYKDMLSLYQTTKDNHTTFVDHIIKPSMVGMPIPAVNYLFESDFLQFDIGLKRMTRLLAEMPIHVTGLNALMINARPYEVKTAMDIAMKFTNTSRAESSAKFATYSLLLSTLGTDYMTNEEKLFNGVHPEYWSGDPLMVQMLMHLQNKDDRDTFFEDWIDLEYEKSEGVPVAINGVLNLDAVCGFPMRAYDGVTKNTIEGYLTTKQDTFDFEAGTAFTSYGIQSATRSNDIDFNQPKFKTKPGEVPFMDISGASDLSDLFYNEKDDGDIPAHMKGNQYDYEPLYANIIGPQDPVGPDDHSRSNFVTFEESLARNGTRVYTSDIFVGDNRSPDTIRLSNEGTPSKKVIENVVSYFKGSSAEVERERYWSAADVISTVIEKKYIIGKGQKERLVGLNLLDSRQGSIFSMYYAINQLQSGGDELSKKFGDTSWYYNLLTEGNNQVQDVSIPGPRVMWDGRPAPDRTELLMHYLSVSQGKVSIDAVKGDKSINTTIPTKDGMLSYAKVESREKGARKYNSLDYLPRPMSESEVISVRRWIVEQLYKESNKHVR